MRRLVVALFLINASILPAQADVQAAAQYPGFREYQWADGARDRSIRVAAWYPTQCEVGDVPYFVSSNVSLRAPQNGRV